MRHEISFARHVGNFLITNLCGIGAAYLPALRNSSLIIFNTASR